MTRYKEITALTVKNRTIRGVHVSEDIPEWERELQAELQEYEVVNDGGDDLDDADLEQELMQQIEAEAKQ